MELTKVQEKIKKESKVAFVISIGAGHLSVVVAAIFLFLVIANGISPGVNHPSPETALKDILVNSAPWIFNGIFAGIISLISAKLFYRIHISYTPFSEKNTKSLKSIAFTASMMGFAMLLFDFISIFVMEFDIRLRAFVIVYLLMGIIFGLFAQIFEYGRLLQQESDELL